MISIGGLLNGFLDVPGVTVAAVVSGDGLVIESVQQDGSGEDVDALAAIASNGLLLVEALGRQLAKGAATQTLLEYERGLALIDILSEDTMLLVVSDDRAYLGRIRLLIREQKSGLQELLTAL